MILMILRNVVDANYFERVKAAEAAQVIINEEIEKFNEWLSSLYVVPIITSLKEKRGTNQKSGTAKSP